MEKNITKVTNGKVTIKKTPGYKKLIHSFVQEDSKTIGEYFFNNIFVPALKKGIEELIHVSLYGTSSGRRSEPGYSTRSTVSYRSYYPEKEKAKVKSNYDIKYDELIFETEDEADRVLTCMDEIVDEYEAISVTEYYRLAGVAESDIPYTLRNYGWTDIHTARIDRTRDGYIIRLPRPMLID